MTYDLMTALVAFAFVTSITPGPNNLMLMASGANFGLRRTVPHALGVALGFVAMAVLVGLGVAEVFERYPVMHAVLTVVSVLYMLWLAWHIATAAAPEGRESTGTPLTFLQAAAFQWVNPKAWTMALGAMTVYAPDGSALSILLVAVVFGMVNLPAVGSWAILGQQMQRVLTNPARLRLFNWAMAALLVASLLPVVMG
ncbi:MAG: LysE family translocator [Pseudomonadota bacterium]